MKKLNQSGLVALEIVLLTVLIVLILATGFYVYKQSQKNDDSSALQGSVQIPDIKSENKDNGKQVAFVEKFYKKYINLDDPSDAAQTAIIKEFGTKNLLAYYESKANSGSDPILCAQMVPNTVTVRSLEAEGETVVLSVSMFEKEINPAVTVKVIDENGLKIDSITCGTAQAN